MDYFYVFLTIVGIAILSYLLGSIPNSVIIGKIFFHKDPREEGSHNAGGTNAGRVLGRKAGVAVILLDGLKIVIPIYTVFLLIDKVDAVASFFNCGAENTLNPFGTGSTLGELAVYIASLFGMIGHCYSIFLKFSGGKAVSTYLGTACCTSYMTFILCGSIFFGTLKLKKYVSLSSLCATFAFMLFSWVLYIIYACNFDNEAVVTVLNNLMWFGFGPSFCIYFPIVMTFGFIIILVKHLPNIKRLKEGTELKIHWMK